MKMPKKRAKTVVIPSSKWIPEDLFNTIQKTMPIVCVDLLILKKNKNNEIETLLIKRKIYPEIGKWCLLGGRIIKGELTKKAIKRQAKEELGVSIKIIPPWNDTTPFAAYNDPDSDKQKHFVVLTFPVTLTKGTLNKYGPEFSEARWFPIQTLPKNIGFHHTKVFEDFIKTKINYNIK